MNLYIIAAGAIRRAFWRGRNSSHLAQNPRKATARSAEDENVRYYMTMTIFCQWSEICGADVCSCHISVIAERVSWPVANQERCRRMMTWQGARCTSSSFVILSSSPWLNSSRKHRPGAQLPSSSGNPETWQEHTPKSGRSRSWRCLRVVWRCSWYVRIHRIHNKKADDNV